jgi:eukaryotic-like serine/threonine-protein kinase
VLEPGKLFDRYTIETFLGQGGMGEVYRAHDAKLDRRVALKIVQVDQRASESEQRLRLIREARAAAKLDHPNAVIIYDVGEHEGTPFIAMEMVDGKTLRALLQTRQAPVEQRVRWLIETARALAHAHDRGIVHRDVKPENVMVRPDGHLKVLDFGIARRLAAPVDPTGPTESPALTTLTTQGTLIGTTHYMSPEQIRGAPLDGRSDQFSWAVTGYELCAGKIPWKGEDALAIAASVLTDPIPALTDHGVPAHVERVLRRALSKAPEDRFTSMHEVATVLENAAAPDFRSFSTQQVSQILRRAVDLGERRRPGLSRDDLAQVAREVGVPDTAVDAALAELARPKAIAERRPRRRWSKLSPAARRRRQILRFKRHAAVYGVFCLFFIALDVFSGPGVWAMWPILGWGIGVALHAVSVWLRDDEPQTEEHEDADEITHGAELLLEATARRRVRVEAISSEPLPAADDELQKNEYEDEEEERPEKRRRRARS